MKDTKTKHADSHYVSHETPQHEPVPVDTDHAEIVEAHGANNSGVTKDQTVRKHEVGVVEKGAQDNRKIVRSNVAERHVQSEPGLKTAVRRHDHVISNRKEKDNIFKK
jgi:hypothetical protein